MIAIEEKGRFNIIQYDLNRLDQKFLDIIEKETDLNLMQILTLKQQMWMVYCRNN